MTTKLREVDNRPLAEILIREAYLEARVKTLYAEVIKLRRRIDEMKHPRITIPPMPPPRKGLPI